MKKESMRKKAEWYDALTDVLNMGFDLDRNTARDLLVCTNEILKIRQEEAATDRATMN